MADEAGDNNGSLKLLYSSEFDDSLLTDVPPSTDPLPLPKVKTHYRVTYPHSLDTQIKKLRIFFESWKEVILPLKSILLWEKQWYPTALIGASTFLFAIIWLIDPTIFTSICVLGFIIVVSDYCVPTFAPTIFRNDKWTSEKERELEELCARLVMYKAKFDLIYGSYCRMRSTNPKMYFSMTVLVLLVLAWIGNTFNNLFLLYALVTFVLLIPGMEHHKMLIKIKASTRQAISCFLDSAKTKLNDSRTSLKKTN